MIVSLHRTLGITLHTVRADYDDCVWWLFFYQKFCSESNNSKCCPAAGTHAEPLYPRKLVPNMD